jgi:hypothetical protein
MQRKVSLRVSLRLTNQRLQKYRRIRIQEYGMRILFKIGKMKLQNLDLRLRNLKMRISN